MNLYLGVCGRGVLFRSRYVLWCPEGEGVNRFQVWVDGTVRNLVWNNMFQLVKKYL